MLKCVVSGFQTGADIGAIIIAHKYNLETGGWIPKGFMTQGGPRPEYAKVGAKEHSSPKYPPRTYANVKDSDATLRFATDFNSSGELCTLKAINQYHKPHMDVDINKPRPVSEVVDWITRYNVVILNVAGNSEHTSPGIAGEVMEYLARVFSSLGFTEKALDASNQ
jgi:hypothetical protein